MIPQCTYCASPKGDLFTPQGEPICSACDQRFRAAVVQQRAHQASYADPIGSQLTFASPKTLILVGAGLMVGALAFGALEVFLLGSVHIVLLGGLFVVGVGTLARGTMR